MAEKVEVILDGQDAGVVRAWLAAKASVESYEKALGSIDTTQKKNQQSAAAFERDARRIYESVETAAEKYDRQLVELRAHLDQGTISQQTFARATKKAHDTMQSAGDGGVKAVGGVTSSLTGLVAGYASLTTAVNFFRQANEEAMRAAEEAATKQDDMFRRFQVQGGLTDLGRAESQGKILQAAESVGVDPSFAAKAATQLVSSGFSVQEATGGSLDILLQGLAASNLTDSDPTQLTQSLGQFLAAQGLDKNATNLQRVLVGSQRLFKATDLQVGDLSQLAGKSQSLSGSMTPEEVLATFDVLREKIGADNASTALKIFGDRLRGAEGDKERTSVLKTLKLKPQDVDFIDEDVRTVLARLSKGFESVPETKRSGLLQKLFGTEASSPIEGLLRDRSKIGDALGFIGDQKGFDEDVRIATSGRNAAGRRQAARRERQLAETNANRDLYGNALEEFERTRGTSPVQTAFRRQAYNLMTGFGFSPETSVRTVSGSDIGNPDNAANVERILGQVSADLRELSEATKANTQATKSGQSIKVNVTQRSSKSAPPPPRPAAALSAGGR